MLRIREFHGKNEEDNRIERKIRDDIRQILTESNTINDEADIVADEIYRAIRYQKFDKTKIVKKEIQKEMNGKNIKLKEYYFSINSTFKQKPILTTVYIFQFPIDEDYDFFIESGGKPCIGNSNSYKGKQNFLTIYCYVSPKYIDYGELYDTIQHELSHLGKTILAGKEMEDYGLISYATTILCSTNANQYQELIANICYIGRQDEQDAYINGAYGYLKEKMPIGGNEIIKCLRRTTLYERIDFLERTIKNEKTIFKNTEFIKTLQNIPQQYGLTLSKLRGWLHHGLKRLKRKTANMLSHYERFVYLRNFRSNPPSSPIDGI